MRRKKEKTTQKDPDVERIVRRFYPEHNFSRISIYHFVNTICFKKVMADSEGQPRYR